MNSKFPTRGFPYYARIAGFLLSEGPKTSREVAEWGGGWPSSTSAIMAQLWARKTIHIHHWIKDSNGNSNTAVWAWGNQPDAPIPLTVRGKPGRLPKFKERATCPEISAFVNFMAAIEEPCSYAMITEEVGIERRTSKRGLDILRGMGVARIADWDTTADRNPAAMFQLGHGPDKSKPRAQRQKKSYYKKKNQKTTDRDRMMRIIRALANVPEMA